MSVVQLQCTGPIATLTINRPDRLNSLGEDGDGEAFAALCKEINGDLGIRCVLLTGAGPAFCAGGDLKAMRDRTGMFGKAGFSLRDAYLSNIHQIVRSLYFLEVPLVAAINGDAIGLGCDLACTADVRITVPAARFGATFLKIGLVPGDGGAWLLPRAIGNARAAQLLFTADLIDARTALDWGLVGNVVDPDNLLSQAEAIARRIAGQPRDALRMTKTLLRQGQSNSFETTLELSASAQALAHQSREHHDGVAALLNRLATRR